MNLGFIIKKIISNEARQPEKFAIKLWVLICLIYKHAQNDNETRNYKNNAY